MFIKLTGALAITVSSFLIGYYINNKSKRHIVELKNLVLCMNIFESEVRYNVCDIISAVDKLEDYASCHNKVIFNDFLHNASNSNGEQLSVVWNKSVNDVKRKNSLCYSDDEISDILNFGKILGSGDCETQLKNIQSFADALNKRIEYEEMRLSENGQLLPKLGIYAGLLIVVFLF